MTNGGARPGAGRPAGQQARPTLEKRALYEKFFVDEIAAERSRKHKRRVPKTTHEKAIQGVVQLLYKAAQSVKFGSRDRIQLDERISGRIPAEVEAPPAMPPFVLMIGANGNSLALGYNPQGVVPGMEAFMPKEVKALPVSGNGHKNGKGRR